MNIIFINIHWPLPDRMFSFKDGHKCGVSFSSYDFPFFGNPFTFNILFNGIHFVIIVKRFHYRLKFICTWILGKWKNNCRLIGELGVISKKGKLKGSCKIPQSILFVDYPLGYKDLHNSHMRATGPVDFCGMPTQDNCGDGREGPIAK